MAEMEKLHLRQIVILEGKYDKIKLESLVDTVIIKTDGFKIYKDREKQKMIRSLAQEYGAVIATDSDAAGFQIRGFLQSLLKDCEVYHLYIPDRYGKEKRKSAPSKEGKLGVEGMPLALLKKALDECGVTACKPADNGIVKADLYELGLSGRPDSVWKRKQLLSALELPEHLSANALIAVLNKKMSKEELSRLVAGLPDREK
jgi:ribonuclease M5